ncbi:deleted in lung and esophageal cancer protein 1 isoform X2 [Ornithorhynchus anatinus]|uniref:deleted in lung and esophageal cancer protein 1 isoform X2 n=1 Tax=Ornithorhynchus anatinus TaxID=9258 RepID=UPI0019D448B8|nr:deleted in lung and esophageal cancer protein 1 isoform X2 [Ornithorhynchus anatinus]
MAVSCTPGLFSESPPGPGRRSPRTPSFSGKEMCGRPEGLRSPAEAAMLRLRPTSVRTQEIAHLLTSVFQDLYTVASIGPELGATFIQSRGGDDPFHEKFVEELQQLHRDHRRRLEEADMVERVIVEARARTVTEEERVCSRAKTDTGDLFSGIRLPSGSVPFRWVEDSKLLKKHHLLCPEDYLLSQKANFSGAPKDGFGPDHIRSNFSHEQHMAWPPWRLARLLHGQKHPVARVGKYLTSVMQPSTPEAKDLDKPTPQASPALLPANTWMGIERWPLRGPEQRRAAQSPAQSLAWSSARSPAWMDHLPTAERVRERNLLARLEMRHNFLRNPQFLPPNTVPGGASLLVPSPRAIRGRRQSRGRGQSAVAPSSSTAHDVPVFLPNPPVVVFTEFQAGQVYEMIVELQNTTASSRHLRLIPPSTRFFSVGLGQFPGEGGLVAPGMSCRFPIRFAPDSLADYEDFLLVETQAEHSLLVPLQAKRPPPMLTWPRRLDCGACLLGGIKLLCFLCTNYGLSRGRFCIMRQKDWPPPTFKAVAHRAFVEEAPFTILPALFELGPGDSVTIEVLFFPTELGSWAQTFIIVCDNCQICDVTITGMGELAAVELVHVSGEESQLLPGEARDPAAQYFVCFGPQNPQVMAEKQLLVRNCSHLQLPFHWRTMKPNLRPHTPRTAPSPAEDHPDPGSAFAVSPDHGVLKAHQVAQFLLTFKPQEPQEYHSVLQMVLEDAIGSPGPEDSTGVGVGDSAAIVLGIEVKGSAEPPLVVLEPGAILIPGANFTGISVRRTFQMWNTSQSAISFSWESVIADHVIEVTPCTGTLADARTDLELHLTGGNPGVLSISLCCTIEHLPQPVVLHIQAAFQGPALTVNEAALNLGLLRAGDVTVSTLWIENRSPLSASWQLQESQQCLQDRGEEESPFSMEPPDGKIGPLGECHVTVLFMASRCQSLRTALVLSVEGGDSSYIPVSAEIQCPIVSLLSSSLVFQDLYLGVPAQAAVWLANHSLLPARFQWGQLLGSQSSLCCATVHPTKGLLGPGEEKELQVELTAHTLEELSQLGLPCRVSGMGEPLILAISGRAQGLHVTLSVPGDPAQSSSEQLPGSPAPLQLDFGSDVVLGSPVKRQLLLTNDSAITAPFTLVLEYFGGGPLASGPPSPTSRLPALMTSRLAEALARKEKQAFEEAVLSQGKGAAFWVQPAQGTLGPFQQLCVDVTAYSNMWGSYSDILFCRVGDLPATVVPVRMGVVGCPISLQMVGPQLGGQASIPAVIRFGTQVSGGDTVSRAVRLNNSSPCDIRMDWETYNPEEDKAKLLDLLLFAGTPFPLRHHDGSEVQPSDGCPGAWGPGDQDHPTTIPGSTPPPGLPPGSPEGMPPSTAEGSDAAGPPSPEPAQKLLSLVLQPREGIPSAYPYGITPRQMTIPARGSATIHLSFTPLLLPEVLCRVPCPGFALGYLSLDRKVDQEVSGKVKRLQHFAVGPLRIDLEAFVKPALLKVDGDSNGGVHFRCTASELIPDSLLSRILTEAITLRRLKLSNCSDSPLRFRLLLAAPFSVWATDPRGARVRGSDTGPLPPGELLLAPGQNMLVTLAFTISLKLLEQQSFPSDCQHPRVQVLQAADGEKRVDVSDSLVLDFGNPSQQLVPVLASVTVPLLRLSTSSVDFGTCFVGQPRSRDIFIMNHSSCRSYWTAVLDKQGRHNKKLAFGVSPGHGSIAARHTCGPPSMATLQLLFTARDNRKYEATVTIHGMLGEEPCTLSLWGQGSFDERFLAEHQV